MSSCRNRIPVNDALVMAAMTLVGLEVDAHLRDGSVASGIFYSASFDDGLAIVLKDARMTKKGDCKSNIAVDSLVATLIILADDLVQVVAKGCQLPSDGEARNAVTKKSEAIVETVPSTEPIVEQLRSLVLKKNEYANGCVPTNAKKNDEGRKLPTNGNQNDLKVEHQRRETKPVEERQTKPGVCVSTSINLAVAVNSKSGHSFAAPSTRTSPHISQPNKIVKESKLNPGAKLFSPSFTKPVPPNPTVPLVHCIPNSVPTTPIPTAPPPVVGLSPFRSHSPLPVKVLPYGYLPAGTVVPDSYVPQLIGHLGGRVVQPLRVSGQYGIPAGQGIVHPSSQSVMAGRPGQVMYVHPASQEIVTRHPQPFARPLPQPRQLQFVKHQGALVHQPYFVAPPLMATVQRQQQQQAFLMPYNVPILQQPFPSNRYIQVPGTNAIFNTKFL